MFLLGVFGEDLWSGPFLYSSSLSFLIDFIALIKLPPPVVIEGFSFASYYLLTSGSFLPAELNYDMPTAGLVPTTFLVRDPFGFIPFVGDFAAEFPSF